MVLPSAAIDVDSAQTMIARLNTDGKTIQRVFVAPTTHRLQVNDGSTGSDNGGTWSAIDPNGRNSLEAVSNSDGITVVALYADSSGNLLIKST